MILRAMLVVGYATDRVSHVRQVKGDGPDKKGYPDLPGWGFGIGLTTPHSKKLIGTIVEQRNALDRFNDDGRRWKELVIDGKNGEVLFDRPKPTADCSANGRRKTVK
jgi:hypothetical protein